MRSVESQRPSAVCVLGCALAFMNVAVLAAAVENRLDGYFDDRMFAVAFLIVAVTAPLAAMQSAVRVDQQRLAADSERRVWRALLIGALIGLPFSVAVVASTVTPR